MRADAPTPAPGPDGASPGTVQAELCDFATHLLEQCGGLVEWTRPGEAGTAMLSPEVSQLIGVE